MQQGIIPAQQAEQKQQHVLSANQLQSLKILRLPALELRTLLSEAICENPLLDIDAQHEQPPEEFAVQDTPAEEDEESEEAELFRMFEARVNAGRPVSDPALVANRAQTFTEMLEEQIGTLPLDEHFADICRSIIHSLNSRGFLEVDPAELASELDLPTEDMMQALYCVQSLQPTGVAARSLEECLILQLAQSSHFNRYTLRLIRNGLPALAKKDLSGLALLLGCDMETAQSACESVRTLNPIPSSGYDTGEDIVFILPDAVVQKGENGPVVVMNHHTLPKLEWNRQYTDMLRNGCPDGIKQYLIAMKAQAASLMRAVENRTDTLLRIIGHMTTVQYPYLTGAGDLSPMIMAEVANATGLHTSTISRTVQNKYIVCPIGTLALKDLFSGGIRTSGGGAVSTEMIKQQLARFIAAEDSTHPLSDEDLCGTLAALGISISRRTVAKYRLALGIPTASQRKLEYQQ